ncbi:ubiquitin thiolesterase, partial [Lasius niger]
YPSTASTRPLTSQPWPPRSRTTRTPAHCLSSASTTCRRCCRARQASHLARGSGSRCCSSRTARRRGSGWMRRGCLTKRLRCCPRLCEGGN